MSIVISQNLQQQNQLASKCLQMTHYFNNLLCSCHFDEVGVSFSHTPFHFKLHQFLLLLHVIPGCY